MAHSRAPLATYCRRFVEGLRGATVTDIGPEGESRRPPSDKPVTQSAIEFIASLPNNAVFCVRSSGEGNDTREPYVIDVFVRQPASEISGYKPSGEVVTRGHASQLEDKP